MFDQVNFFPLRQDTVLNDYDEEEHFIRVNTDGKTAKFKLTKKDWELMEIKEYPSGGRLLGGAWTTIFRRGVKQSNEWCNLRLTNNQVRAENSRRMHSSPFFRGAGECKFPECNAKVKFVIHKEIRDVCGKCLPQISWVAYGKEMNSHMVKKAPKKLLERASCLGLLEINELVEC